MGFAGRIVRCVFVAVMLVVRVRMFVKERLVRVLVQMALGQMEPDAENHEATCDEKAR